MRALLPLLLTVPLVAASCAPRSTFIQTPDFAVQSVRLDRLTLPGVGGPATAYLTLRLRVENPNPFPIRIARAGGTLFLDGQGVGQIELPDVNLPARGTAEQTANVAVPVTLGTAARFLSVARGQAVPYRVEGSFTVDAGLIGTPTFGPYVLSQGVIKQPKILP